jgi:hypothetical protein
MLGVSPFVGGGLESNANVAAGMGVQVGWMLRPTWALMLDTHGAAVGRSDVSDANVSASVLTHTVVAAAAQWWPRERWWVRGGIGPGWIDGATTSVGITPSAEIQATRSGFGATLAAGYELYRGSLFALDLNLRYSGVRADGDGYSSIVAGLGFGWYPSTTPKPLETAREAEVEEVPSAPKPHQWRGGWLLGLSAVGGLPINNDCDDCYWDAGGGMAFEVGWMLTPRLGLMVDTHGMAVGRSEIQGYDDENNALVQGVAAFACQYWPAQRFWIKGGLGSGQVRASATVTANNGATLDIVEMETGFGFLTAAGYEFYQGASLAMDAQLRYAGIYGDALNRGNLVVGVGVAWYP